MRPFPCLLASALLVALVAPAAWARGDDMFKLMDGNNDGRISTQEHDAGAAAMFARMDANHDGMLDAGEMGPRMRHAGGMHGGGMHGEGMHGGGWMARMDGNHDGVITAAEHAAAAQAMFNEMDADHDGRLVAAERQAGHPAPGRGMDDHGMQPDSDKDDPAMGHHDMAGHGMHGQGGMAAAHMKMQATMDADHDGRVSASEHAAAARSMFAKADADHDGYVTKAEFSARKEAMRQP